MGLGTYPEAGIALAREKAMAARKCLQSGKDPIEERLAARAAQSASAAVLTFEQAARNVHEQNKTSWKNQKHANQWINTLRDYVFPTIGRKKVDTLAPEDFADVLKPIWLKKAETASRVKQRCHAVMKWCWAHRFVSSNPLDVVDYLLPQQPGKNVRVQHQPAMPWRVIPSFVADVLRSKEPNVTRLLLEFVILTAARSGEARAMSWDEIDFDHKIWTVPGSRMKTNKMHRVPLSARAIEILDHQREQNPDSSLVFPSLRGKQLSDMALTKFLRDHNVPSGDAGRTATVHGFRSSFRDWASEHGYSRDWAERALAHTIKNQAEAAYHRTDLLEQRRGMMEAWANHVVGTSAEANVIPLAGAR